MRKKIGIYVDYALRIPAFNESYTLFKNFLFDRAFSSSNADEKKKEDQRYFWQNEFENKEIENFYLKTKCSSTDLQLKNSTFKEFFFNKEHLTKFLDEYSFNLYGGDCLVPKKKDIDFLNIAQSYLFDVILLDEYVIPKKKLHTMFFLSTIRIMPQALFFIGPGQNIDESSYFGIWNPVKNSGQINDQNSEKFELWLKELEKKNKEENAKKEGTV